MYNGIDRITQYDNLLQGKRLGVLTSSSGKNKELISTTQLLSDRYNVTAFFAPEHGIRGEKEAGEIIETYLDPTTGVPVHSMYRADSKRFTADMLENVDCVVYDIQDIGTRYYTYISALHNTLEDCAAFDKEIVVLDRYNPLGDTTEGNILDINYKSFVGTYSIPMRHGLTIGEFARMVQAEQGIDCDLKIVLCEGWDRHSLHPETGNFWLTPSPNMPRFKTALIYPGSCLFEGTNLSEGRGTTIPFECVGAPFIDGEALAKHMNEKGLKGVRFTPYYFTPFFSKHKDTFCQGVKYNLSDYNTFESVKTGLELLYAVRELYPDSFQFLPPVKEGGRAFIELLEGDSSLLEGKPLDQVLAKYKQDSENFIIRKQPYLLY